jgi:hypothetical protein
MFAVESAIATDDGVVVLWSTFQREDVPSFIGVVGRGAVKGSKTVFGIMMHQPGQGPGLVIQGV